MSFITGILGISLAIYLLICLGAYLIQDYFLFHPEKLPGNFEFSYDTPFREVFIHVKDGSIINGLLFKTENPKGVVFYFKGNTRSVKGWGARFSGDFLSKGYDFFIIDYPGFGKSVGKRTERTIFNDGHQAYKWLKKYYPEDQIVIYGRSLGAGFASFVARENKPRMLILDSPYYSFTRLAYYYAPILPLKWLIKYSMPVFKDIKWLKCPLYIIHGTKDRLIPYKFSPMLVAVRPENSQLFPIKGAKHNNLPETKQYHDTLNYILDKGGAGLLPQLEAD